jgi:hypothetical protein
MFDELDDLLLLPRNTRETALAGLTTAAFTTFRDIDLLFFVSLPDSDDVIAGVVFACGSASSVLELPPVRLPPLVFPAAGDELDCRCRCHESGVSVVPSP